MRKQLLIYNENSQLKRNFSFTSLRNTSKMVMIFSNKIKYVIFQEGWYEISTSGIVCKSIPKIFIIKL